MRAVLVLISLTAAWLLTPEGGAAGTDWAIPLGILAIPVGAVALYVVFVGTFTRGRGLK